MGRCAPVKSYPGEAMWGGDTERKSERFPNGSEQANPHSGSQSGHLGAIR